MGDVPRSTWGFFGGRRIMSENKKDDALIDIDEIDELPDVVLGEETLAMRTLRENGKTAQKKPVDAAQNKQNESMHRTNAYDKAIDIPDEKEQITVETPSVKNDAIEQKLSRLNKNKSTEETVVLEKTEEDLHLDELKAGQKYRNGTKILYLDNEVEIEDFNPNTSRYKIVDKGRTKWVTDKNLKLIDPEVPVSLQDEDPAVADELSDVLQTKEEHPVNQTMAIDPQRTSTPKHARTDKQKVIPTNPVPFEELYKEAYVPHEETAEEKAIRMKKKKKTPIAQKIVSIILCILIILLVIGVYTLYTGLQPVSQKSEEVPFMVEDGETVKTVAQKLQDEGIIRNAEVASTYAKIYHLTDVKQGLFTLDKSWDIKQMFTYLNDQNAAGRDQVAVTVIEGDWAKDAAKKFEEVTNVSSKDLLALWNDKDWITSQMEKYPFLTNDMFNDGVRIYLEGYLAPDTYYVNKETTAEEITTTLLDQSLKVYEKYADAIKNSGHSIAEIYTMASIIQYEAGTNPDDLAKVASVFYNRLKQGMKLQSSVTVCYAIDFDKLEDNWQSCEVNPDYDSPYNTYAHEGLTPGPIENAGEAAIKAAIEPADTNYLYFMAEVCPGGDGTVHYAETISEHNANVAKYLNCY